MPGVDSSRIEHWQARTTHFVVFHAGYIFQGDLRFLAQFNNSASCGNT